MHSPFDVLGVRPDASRADIKRAFRRLAMDWHPDRNPTREAEERFKFIKAAYELVLDPERLAAWQSQNESAAGAAAAQDDGDETGDAGQIAATLHLELEAAAHGCTREIEVADTRVCAACAGSGQQEHAMSVACQDCRGIGRLRNGAHCRTCAGRGYVRTTPCPACAGRGNVASSRRLAVRIPPGVLPGERLRLRRGDAGNHFVIIDLAPHPLFALSGRDLEVRIPVSIFRLLAGGAMEVPTLDGTESIKLATYPAHGLDYTLHGRGFPGRHGKPAGDLHLRLQPVYPRQCESRERQLLERLDHAMRADAAHLAPELADWEQRMRARSGR